MSFSANKKGCLFSNYGVIHADILMLFMQKNLRVIDCSTLSRLSQPLQTLIVERSRAHTEQRSLFVCLRTGTCTVGRIIYYMRKLSFLALNGTHSENFESGNVAGWLMMKNVLHYIFMSYVSLLPTSFI